MTEERGSSGRGRRGGQLPYDQWIESLGLPIYRGHSGGQKSLMPDRCYTDSSFDWDYGEDR